jgi:hypothetical protein
MLRREESSHAAPVARTMGGLGDAAAAPSMEPAR